MLRKKTFLAEQTISGFRSPADDHLEGRLDISDRLVVDPHCTFYFKMSGDSMAAYGIEDGALLVVDRSLHAVDGCVVIASIGGELLCRSVVQENRTVTLVSTEDTVIIDRSEGIAIWGVVIAACKPTLPASLRTGRYSYVCTG